MAGTRRQRYQLARAISTALAAHGAYGVALTGSMARGDDAPGSDVDLWVIGWTNARLHLVQHGVPVTLICETIRRAFSLAHLGRVEVQQARPLHDPHAVFARLQAFHRRHERRLTKATLAGLRREIASLDAASRRGPNVTRLLHAREALHRAVLAVLYARHGLRTPKLRHVRRHLGVSFAREYARAMGLAPRPGLLRSLRLVAGPGGASAVPAKLRAGAFEEAHELARLEARTALSPVARPLAQLRAIGRLVRQREDARQRALVELFSIPSEDGLPAALERVSEARARVRQLSGQREPRTGRLRLSSEKAARAR